ncbi:uncharacterized protein RCO7_09457 [Rhynchosporium graminicola]|uniref:Uncharacterized protein n=1 Tax=Rhynchosporium graminicola TaxID=2792576 RepID=A0A1E1K6U7_9HELO|nr:uncharacterized protein RCO7_09457 [Rhynchosporium commune]
MEHTLRSKIYTKAKFWDKYRLYLGVYGFNNVPHTEGDFHWALIIGPKVEKNSPVVGFKFVNYGIHWRMKEQAVNDIRYDCQSMVARIVIAKVADRVRLFDLLRKGADRAYHDDTKTFSGWIEAMLQTNIDDGKCVGTAELDFQKITAFAEDYVINKARAGRYEFKNEERFLPKPTYDLLAGKELIP